MAGEIRRSIILHCLTPSQSAPSRFSCQFGGEARGGKLTAMQFDHLSRVEAPFRRAAPDRDETPQEATYDLNHICRYVRSAFPHRHGSYRLDEIAAFLKDAAADIEDDDHGIERA